MRTHTIEEKKLLIQCKSELAEIVDLLTKKKFGIISVLLRRKNCEALINRIDSFLENYDV